MWAYHITVCFKYNRSGQVCLFLFVCLLVSFLFHWLCCCCCCCCFDTVPFTLPLVPDCLYGVRAVFSVSFNLILETLHYANIIANALYHGDSIFNIPTLIVPELTQHI